MYYAYVLSSKKDHELYVGHTNDLQNRIKKHKRGKARATMFRRPLLLIYYEAYLRWSDAKRREKYLKGGNGRAQLKIQLQDILKDVGYRHQKWKRASAWKPFGWCELKLILNPR